MPANRREVIQGGLAAFLLPGLAAAQPPGAGAPAPPSPREGGGPAGRESTPSQNGQQRGAVPEQPRQKVHALVLSQSYWDKPGFALPNTAGDAALIVDAFRKLRFDRIALLSNTDKERTLRDLTDFLEGIGPDDLALLYLAGHGLEVAGENLFMLGDARSFLSLQALVQLLQDRAGVTALFLDACRNNPYYGAVPAGDVTRAVRTRSAIGAGVQLETVDLETVRARSARPAGKLSAFSLAGSSVKIVFSTDPGNFALDGARPSSRYGPFAQALAKRIRQPISLDDVVSLTTGDVRAATRRRQSPWSQGSVDRPIFLSPRRRRTTSARRTGSRLPAG